MDYKRLGLGLGIFSIALGAAEILATRRIAQGLDNDSDTAHSELKAFGAREIAAGANLLMNPAHAAGVWNRVAGDAMDLAALGLAARNSPRSVGVWAAIGFVAGATALDILTARGLDRQTGKTLPTEPRGEETPARELEPA